MENRQANKLDNSKDVKTGQSAEMRRDNVYYESYANMSDAEVEKLREKRSQNRTSNSGQVLKTFVPERFKNPNLHYEWVIENPIDLDRRIADGWVVVQNEELSKLKGCSTTSNVAIPSGANTSEGKPERLVLMAIHKKLWEDDEKAKKQRIKELDDYINSGRVVGSPDGEKTPDAIKVKEVNIE